jgi:hypothetical protein
MFYDQDCLDDTRGHQQQGDEKRQNEIDSVREEIADVVHRKPDSDRPPAIGEREDHSPHRNHERHEQDIRDQHQRVRPSQPTRQEIEPFAMTRMGAAGLRRKA